MICNVNIYRTCFFWPAKFIHQNLVAAFILTGAKEPRIQVCGFFWSDLFVSNLTIKHSLTEPVLQWRCGGAACSGHCGGFSSAHVEKPRVRTGVRNVSFITGCCGISNAVHMN